MRNVIFLLDGILMILGGVFTLLVRKNFSSEVQKFDFVKYGKPQELGIKICFYIIGVSLLVSGISLIYKYFKT